MWELEAHRVVQEVGVQGLLHQLHGVSRGGPGGEREAEVEGGPEGESKDKGGGRKGERGRARVEE